MTGIERRSRLFCNFFALLLSCLFACNLPKKGVKAKFTFFLRVKFLGKINRSVNIFSQGVQKIVSYFHFCETLSLPGSFHFCNHHLSLKRVSLKQIKGTLDEKKKKKFHSKVLHEDDEKVLIQVISQCLKITKNVTFEFLRQKWPNLQLKILKVMFWHENSNRRSML